MVDSEYASYSQHLFSDSQFKKQIYVNQSDRASQFFTQSIKHDSRSLKKVV